MRVDELGAPTVPIVYDRALTHVIRSCRVLEETESRLAEALMIVEALGDPSEGRIGERAAWARELDDPIRALSAVRTALWSLPTRTEASQA